MIRSRLPHRPDTPSLSPRLASQAFDGRPARSLLSQARIPACGLDGRRAPTSPEHSRCHPGRFASESTGRSFLKDRLLLPVKPVAWTSSDLPSAARHSEQRCGRVRLPGAPTTTAPGFAGCPAVRASRGGSRTRRYAPRTARAVRAARGNLESLCSSAPATPRANRSAPARPESRWWAKNARVRRVPRGARVSRQFANSSLCFSARSGRARPLLVPMEPPAHSRQC